MTQRLLQLLVTGLTTGSLYALIGLGVTLTYSTTRVINVAIGEFAMISAMTAASLATAGVPLAVALPAGVVAGTLCGAAMYQFAVVPARRRGADVLTLVIMAIALQWVLEGVGLLIWSTRSYALAPFTPGPPVRLLSAVITRQNIWVVVVTLALLATLHQFLRRTDLGKALRACAVNPIAARLTGISVYRMGLAAFVLSALLASAAGVLIAPQTLATYDMGLGLSLKAFIAASIAKLESPVVTVAGALLLGLFEQFATGLLPAGWGEAAAFLLLLVVLVGRAIPLARGGILTAEKAFAE